MPGINYDGEAIMRSQCAESTIEGPTKMNAKEKIELFYISRIEEDNGEIWYEIQSSTIDGTLLQFYGPSAKDHAHSMLYVLNQNCTVIPNDELPEGLEEAMRNPKSGTLSERADIVYQAAQTILKHRGSDGTP